jgi:hypothetical protein
MFSHDNNNHPLSVLSYNFDKSYKKDDFGIVLSKCPIIEALIPRALF